MKGWVLRKKSAFLLIEQLMALAIFAVSFLLISGVYQVLMKVQSKLEVPNCIEWHLMVTQLDTHLQGYARPPIVFEHKFEDGRPIKEESYFIRAKSENNQSKNTLWISKGEGKKKGYHPLLIGYKELHMHGEKDGVQFQAILRNKEIFELYFIPGNRVISLEKEVIQEEHKKEKTNDEKSAIVPKDKS